MHVIYTLFACTGPGGKLKKSKSLEYEHVHSIRAKPGEEGNEVHGVPHIQSSNLLVIHALTITLDVGPLPLEVKVP